MLLIWRGWGILGAVVPFALFLGAILLADALKLPLAAMGALVLVAGIFTTGLLWTLGKRLNAQARTNHSLFFIPLQWCGVVFGVLVMVYGAVWLADGIFHLGIVNSW